MCCIDTKIVPQLLEKHSQVCRLRAYIHKHINICTTLKKLRIHTHTHAHTHIYIHTAGVILGRLSIDTCDDYWTKHSDLVGAKSLSSVDSKTQRKNAKHINKLLSIEMLSIYWNDLVIGEFKLTYNYIAFTLALSLSLSLSLTSSSITIIILIIIIIIITFVIIVIIFITTIIIIITISIIIMTT